MKLILNRQLGIVERAMDHIRACNVASYANDRMGNDRMAVYRDGDVLAFGIGFMPLTWSQRRTIGRAFMRKAKELDQQIMSAGREALRKAPVAS